MLDALSIFNRHFIQFGTGLCVLIAIIEASRRKKGEKLTPLFYMGLCLALIQLRFGMYRLPAAYEQPWSSFLFVPAIFCFGPLFILINKATLTFANHNLPPFPYHLIPAGLALLGDLYFQLFMPYEFKSKLIYAAFVSGEMNFANLVLLLGIIHAVAYSVFVFYHFRRIKSSYELRISNSIYTILIVSFLSTLFQGLGHFLLLDLLFFAGAWLFTITLILLFTFRARYPNFMDSLVTDLKEQRYTKTRLNGINMDAIKERLDQLINTEKIFFDENLRLHHLAEELQISKNQVSRILNETYNKNFYEFINYYRVEEAKKQLQEEPDKTILKIAFDVGFNTKATFNSQFLKIQGESPQKFRKRVLEVK